MIFFLTVLSLALLGTLGCIGTLVYVLRKERAAAAVITDAAELRKIYIQVTSKAVAERAVNSWDAYAHPFRPEAAIVRSSTRRQTYQRAAAC